MKNLTNGLQSTTTLSSYLDEKVASLNADQLEAIRTFASLYSGNAPVEFSISTIEGRKVSLALTFKGSIVEQLEELEAKATIFSGKVATVAEAIIANEVLHFMAKKWQGSECVASYGEVRHQLCQLSRGYMSQAHKTSDKLLKEARYEVANWLLQREAAKDVLRRIHNTVKILNKVGKVLIISEETEVNTFEFLRGQGGKVRISLLLK